MNKNRPYSNYNSLHRYIILHPNPTIPLIEKKIKSHWHENHYLLNKNNETNSKIQLQKRRFPVQRNKFYIGETSRKLNNRIYEQDLFIC